MLLGNLTWTLFPAGAPAEEIAAYVAEAERRVAPARPCLVYLRQEDVAEVVRRIAQRRGTQWTERKVKQYEALPYNKARAYAGFDGLVAYWEDYQRLADELFERSTLAKRLVPVDPADWGAGWRHIAAFLEVPVNAATGSAISAADLERYAGTYSYTQRDKEAHCQIALGAGRLVVTGLADVWRETPLVPIGPAQDSRFALESYPIEVTFDVRPDGAVRGAHLTGPPPLWGNLTDRLTRVD